MKLRIPRASLRTRIIAWSFVPTTIILLAVALVVFYAYRQVTEDLVVGRNQELTRLSASQLATGLTDYAETLTMLARTPDIYQNDPAAQSAALKGAHSSLLVFDGGVVILNHLGRVTAAEPERPELSGQDWSNRSNFREIIRSATSSFSDIVPDGPQGAEVIALAVPVLSDRGEFRGTMVGMFRLGATSFSAFYAGIVKLRLGENSSTYLVDSAGRVIYHPDAARIGRDVHAQPGVQQALKRQPGYLRTVDLNNRDMLATFAPVPGTPWGLINEESWTGLLESKRGYGQFLLLLLGLGVVVPTLVVTFGVKRITDPVAKLIAAAKEIAGGNFGQQITVHTGDELEELVKQFNLMSVELSESYTQLEQRVAARTQELATLNAIGEVVSRSLDLKEILNAALDQTLGAIGMELGGAYRIEEGSGDRGAGAYLTLIAQRGLSEEFIRRASPRPLRGSVVEIAATAGQPIVWQIAECPEIPIKESLEREGVRQILCVPLMVKRKLVGAFNLGTRATRPITTEELSLLAAIGQQIGVAVENARLYDQAEQSASLAERTRLARELHDSVTQSLYSVTMYAEAAALALTAGKQPIAVGHLHELRDTAQEALREMRLLIFELRPLALEQNGLAAALQARLEAVEGRGGMKTELQVKGAERLSLAVQQELYHIAQEALNNVIKHAHAQCVRVHLLFSDDCACLEICDDGEGFDATSSHSGGLGLAGMHERAQKIGGKLEITSSPGNGTRVRVNVPSKEGTQGSSGELGGTRRISG